MSNLQPQQPQTCGECPFFTMSDEDKRPNWCPLKEVIENVSLVDELADIALYYLKHFCENERFIIEDYAGEDWQSKINDLEAEYQLKKYKINELRKRLSND